MEPTTVKPSILRREASPLDLNQINSISKNMDLISIILPYYRKKEFIKKTIFSVINQTYKRLELIIVFDDPTKKDDLKYIKDISKIDKRIKILVNKKNIGAGLSRNKGIKFSKGNYIAFIDADDLWKKNKLLVQLKFMKNFNYNITHTSYKIINSKQKTIGFRKAEDLTFKDLIKSCDIGLSTVMLKKKILEKNLFASLRTKEDYVLWLKITLNKNKIFALENYLTKWRKLDDSLSSSKVQKFYDGYLVYRKYMNFSLVKSLIYLLLLSFRYVLKELKNK